MKARPAKGGIQTAILREWRGCDEADDPNENLHRAEEFVAAILRAAGAADGIDEEELKAAWRDLAGDFVYRHTRPASVRGGHLVLQVTQPAMRFHLEQMKPMLLERIRRRFGDGRIHSIKFTHG